MLRTLATVSVAALVGCAIVKVPDGPLMVTFGQSSAVYCPAAAREPDPDFVGPTQGCTVVRGGALSDGAVDLLKKVIEVPGALVRGMGAGLP